MCTHRTYRHLAERLASAGFHALRFDYHGTGDSSGHADEPGRLEAWLDNVASAIDELEAVAGVRSVDLFGVRVGATLAALAAGRRRDVRSLVLWAPCASGRAYVRELRAFQTLKEKAGARAATPLGDAGEEVAGYWFDAATLVDLSTINLLASRERLAERALVVPRDDLAAGEEQLAAHLAACGVEAVARADLGYAEMMRDPQDAVVPSATLDAIVAWLGASGGRRAATCATSGVPSSVLTSSSHATRCLVREESLRFGEAGRLFGIITEPRAGPTRGGRTAIVFLNVGANHRVGPNRMYVSLARDLAALGYLCFRFDRAGLGDSPSANGSQEGRVYSKDAVGDVKAAITFLGDVRAVDRIVAIGLCSGAHLAFHTGLVDPRVAGQVLITARPVYKSTRYYLGAALKPRVWRQAVRGALDVCGVAGALRGRLIADSFMT
jgi:alpha-beta hydrolase superfamily lysophospholipase